MGARSRICIIIIVYCSLLAMSPDNLEDVMTHGVAKQEKPGSKRLRQENNALDLDHLSSSQRKAMIDLTLFIEQGLSTSINSIDSSTNRLLFLSGDKGSGKSSLVYTLRAKLSDFSFGRHGGEARNIKIDNYGPEALDAIIQHARTSNWQYMIRWLAPLSLDPLPDGTNLAGALLGRIEDAVAQERERGTISTGLFHTTSQLEKVRHGLDSLKSDALMALEGNLHTASSQLDPENFALRAAQAELNKINLNRRLDTALNGFFTATDADQGVRKQGLFIQVIDDIDIRPSRAVEMLKLAYSLSVPRLLFIILGHIEALDEVLFYNVKGEFCSLLHQADAAAMTKIEATANELSSNLLRKMLPLSQRIELGDLTVNEAMQYPRNANGSGDAENLSAQLAKYIVKNPALPAGSEEITLRDLITYDAVKNSQIKDLKPEDTIGEDLPYDGVSFFSCPPRHLADLYQLVRSNDDLIGVLQSNFTRIVDEDGLLGQSIQRKLKECAIKSGELWDIAPPPMQMIACRGPKFEIPVDRRARKAAIAQYQPEDRYSRFVLQSFRLGGVSRYEIAVEGEGEQKILGSRTRPAFKLLHDATLFLNKGNVDHLIPLANPDEIACTVWDDRRSAPMTIPWQTFEWKTFWHRDQFTAMWRQGVARLQKIAMEPAKIKAEHQAKLAGLYFMMALIETALKQGGDERELSKIDGTEWVCGDGMTQIDADIAKKVQEIEVLIHKKTEAGQDDIALYHLTRVIENIVFLGTPEVGLPFSMSGDIINIDSSIVSAAIKAYSRINLKRGVLCCYEGDDPAQVKADGLAYENYNNLRLDQVGVYVLSPTMIAVMKDAEMAGYCEISNSPELSSLVRQLHQRIGRYSWSDKAAWQGYVAETDVKRVLEATARLAEDNIDSMLKLSTNSA